MNENFLFEDQTLKTDIFSDYEDTPTEKNPFPSLPLAKKYFKSRAKNLRDLLDFFCGI